MSTSRDARFEVVTDLLEASEQGHEMYVYGKFSAIFVRAQRPGQQVVLMIQAYGEDWLQAREVQRTVA